MRCPRGAVVATAAAALVVPSTAASAHVEDHGEDDATVTTVARELDGPRQLDDYGEGRLVVAESDTGEVSSVDLASGEVRALLSDLGYAQGVGFDDGLLFVAVGTPGPGEAPRGRFSAALVVATPEGEIVRTVDLLAYEEANNPDGQVQLVNGQPVDALANPYAVLVQDDRVLVADGGANDVLAVDRETGEVSTFFVPPNVTADEVPECGQPEAQANPGTEGCDSVPTGVVEGPDGLVYVSTLGAEQPGASRVYVLTDDGEVVDVVEGLTGVAGLAVDRDGAVYVAELLESAPESVPPPPGFDPAVVGQLVRIAPDGERTVAQVTMPTGLEFHDGRLYASAWSVAAFVGLQDAGEVVRIGRDVFVAPAS